MKIIILLLSLFFTSTANSGTKPPTLADYPVREIYTGMPVRVDLNSHPEARMFRSRLSDGLKDGPNFAGHYAIIYRGCGTACQMLGIVDVRNGKVKLITSYSFNSYLMPTDVDPLRHRQDSELLIVAGTPNDREPGQYGYYYYRWTGRELKLLRYVPFPPAPAQ